MKMKLIFVFFVLFAVMALAGCGRSQDAPTASTTPNTYLPTIMYDGKLYRSTFKGIEGEFDQTEIIGNVSSTVPLSQLPTENGQANFGDTDTPYAMTESGLVVMFNGEWTLFSEDTNNAS